MKLLDDLVIGALVGKVSVWAYNNLLTPEQRKKFENMVNTHHFEYGVVAIAGGVITKSPKAVGLGISYLQDDWKDKDIAIKNLKSKINSAVNQIQKALQTPPQVPYSNPFIQNPRMRQMSRINY